MRNARSPTATPVLGYVPKRASRRRALQGQLQELQEEDPQAQKIRAGELKEGWEDSGGVLHRHGLPYVPEMIRTELISRNYENPLAEHFGIEKTRELNARKYY